MAYTKALIINLDLSSIHDKTHRKKCMPMYLCYIEGVLCTQLNKCSGHVLVIALSCYVN